MCEYKGIQENFSKMDCSPFSNLVSCSIRTFVQEKGEDPNYTKKLENYVEFTSLESFHPTILFRY